MAESEDRSLAVIQVQCEACQQVFEVSAQLSGLSEFCPACGELTDIPRPDELGEPSSESPIDEQAMASPGSGGSAEVSLPVEAPNTSTPLHAIYSDPVDARGLPVFLWWILALGAVGGFSGACYYLLSDNWESRHVQELTDDVSRADAFFSGEDMGGAAREYQAVIDEVSNRDIQSIYIRDLVIRSRQGADEARRRLRLASRAAHLPTTLPGDVASSQPAPTAGDMGMFFQEAGDRLPHVAWEKPTLYQDDNGNWRHRQFVVWNVNCVVDDKTDPPKGTLDYMCESRISMPHSNPDGAGEDNDLINKEWRSPVHRVATFQLIGSRWRETGSSQELVSGAGGGIAKQSKSFRALSDLESQVFSADQTSSSRPSSADGG